MELRELTESGRAEYNRFVAQHPSGSFLQSWDWGVWQEQLGHKVHRFFVADGGSIHLAAQVIETVVPRLNRSYLYIPYGPLAVDTSRTETIDFFLNQLKQKFPQNIFIRIESKDNFLLNGTRTAHIQPGKTLILDLQRSTDELLAAMHPKTRYNIKVAQRHGVRVINEPIITPGYGLYLKEVVELLVTTAKRQDFKSHPTVYYQKLIDFFAMQSPQLDCRVEIYRAVLEQELLAAAVMIDFGPTRTYLFGGTTEQQKNVMAPYMLHWQAIQDAKNKGLRSYDFWGIETASGKTPGFVRFKLGWGGQIVDYPQAVDLIQKPAWYTIYNVLRRLNRKFL